MRTKRKWNTRASAAVLAIALVLTSLPEISVLAEGAIAYNGTYTGNRGPLTLSTGTYLLKNLTIQGTVEHPSAIEISGDVTIYLEGSSTLTGVDSSWDNNFSKPAGAGIYVPNTSSLTIRGNGTLYANGGKACLLYTSRCV